MCFFSYQEEIPKTKARPMLGRMKYARNLISSEGFCALIQFKEARIIGNDIAKARRTTLIHFHSSFVGIEDPLKSHRGLESILDQ